MNSAHGQPGAVHTLLVNDVTIADTSEGPVHKSDPRLTIFGIQGETAVDRTSRQKLNTVSWSS